LDLRPAHSLSPRRDGLSVFLVILTTFLTAISVIASWNSIHERIKEFFVMLLMLEVGIIGVSSRSTSSSSSSSGK